MYNQVNHNPHFGQGPYTPVPPAYQQCPQPPPPPPHFQQGPQGPPVQHVRPAVSSHIGHAAPQVYRHGPPATSFTVPLNPTVQVPPSVMQNTGQSYVIPTPLSHGNSMMPQTFSNAGHNSQHSNLGQTHHMTTVTAVPPPPLGHTHQEKSWAPGLKTRALPPLPPPPSSLRGQTSYEPFKSYPPQSTEMQSLHHNLPPPPPPSASGFLAPSPDPVYLHSTVGNCRINSVTSPPLPSSPPPIPPSPPPLASTATSASTLAVSKLSCLDSDPNSSKLSGSELKAVNSVDEVVASYPSGIAPICNTDLNQDNGSDREVATADRDKLSSTRSVILDLPPPPPRPTEENIVCKIEALCQLIAENGSGIEDKIRRDKSNNPEYAFLFGGDPGSEAAISHEFFQWMKKKYILEQRWHDKESESQLRPLAVDTSQQHDHLNIATECNAAADSDIEMEDDITHIDKDQGLNHTIEGLNQQHDGVNEEFSMNEQRHQLHFSMENNPVNDILSSDTSYFGSFGVSKQDEGPGLLSDFERVKFAISVTKVHSPVNDLTAGDDIPMGSVVEKSAASLADVLTQQSASEPVEAKNPDGDSGQLISSGSPIRLLQDYASDDTSDNADQTCNANVTVLVDSAGAGASTSIAHKDSGSYLETGIGYMSPSNTHKGFGLLSKISQNDSGTSHDLVQDVKGTHTKSVSIGTSDGCVEYNLKNQVSVNLAAPIETFQENDGLSSAGIGYGSKSGNTEPEDEKKTSKFESNKVDEFGRLARECPTNSDSDDSRYHRGPIRRRQNKRDRSWSRSRSPLDRRSGSRRRRRSPCRRKERRSRSRSWSPRDQRSRSRSSTLRHSGEFSSENAKRDKGQCFDFLRGKCYRGAFCRYLHNESDKNASSRRHRSKHDKEVSCPTNSSIHEGMRNTSSKVSGYDHDGVRSGEVQLSQIVGDSSTGQEVDWRMEDPVRNAVVSATLDHGNQSVNIDPIEPQGSRQVALKVSETLEENENFQKAVDSHQKVLVDDFPAEALSSGDACKQCGGTSQDVNPSENGLSAQQFQSNVSVGVLEHSDHPSQHINVSSVFDSIPDKRSMTSTSEISSSELLPYMLPTTQLQSATSSDSQRLLSESSPLCPQASKEFPVHSTCAVDLPLMSYQLPPPPALSHSRGENAVHMPEMSRDYGVMQQNAFSYQSITRESFQPYSALLHTEKSHFSLLPNSSWTSSLPPPPPRTVYASSFNAGDATSYVSTECNRSQLHSRTNFVSQTSVRPALPSHSQGSHYQDQAYPPMQEHSQPLMLTEAFSSKPLPQSNPASQSLAGPNLGREDHFNQLPMQDSKFSSSSSFGSLHPQPKHFSWESDVNRLQPSSDDKLPPEEHFKTFSHIHPFSQKQQPIYSFQHSASAGSLGMPGETATVSRYPPDVLDSNHSASHPDFGGSRISAHYNPYASTFEQPLSSRFSSSIFRQEKDIVNGNDYGSSSSLNHINGQRVCGVGSRQTTYSPKSSRAVGQILPRSGGDQYDPLFDSIEPSSTSLKKFDLDQKQEVTGESNISLRPKGSYKSLDVEENNKHEEVAVVASTTSQNNDEYGETADAEVGAVENDSLSDHVDVANMTTGEIEIDQIKSPGKKKSKDSRSMKLFKVSIANFVKEVLKPSWRQGNMSKVAFKTIVKKTVDKVSGAMKGHHVPKSQAKINQYIDSSQRKLTKLVMGYVDKYVKA